MTGYIKKICLFALLLGLVVVVLGAWVRLSHAGLGCPDWPGCYGQWFVTEKTAVTAEQELLYEEFQKSKPYDEIKAKKEMLHRYVAGLFGFVILVLAGLIMYDKHSRHLRLHAAGILTLVILQALLGMWTVTLLLKPAVVVLHLLGGMSILALLGWLVLRLSAPLPLRSVIDIQRIRLLRVFAWLGLAGLVIQIILGGWVSTNYAALVCLDFPTCQGEWLPVMDFQEGFRVWRDVGVDYEGGVLSAEARTAIHMLHRFWAVVAVSLLLLLGVVCICQRQPALRFSGIGLIIFTVMQISLGIANVLLRLPLPIATAHNAVAALLLLGIVTILHFSGNRRY